MTFFYDMNKKLKAVLEAPKSVNQQLNEGAHPGVVEAGTGDYSAKKARAGKDIGKPGKAFAKIAKSAGEKYGSKERGKKVAGAVLAKLRGKRESIEQEGNAFGAAVRKAKADGIQPGEKVNVGGKEYPVKEEGGKPMTPKQKKFAKLAPPADKITFADKIAGAKKEVDEMLGDVAAEAMRKAVKGNKKVVADEGWDEMTAAVKKRAGQMKTGEKIKGHKGEIEKTATGLKHTRSYDPKTGETDTDGDEKPAGEKRGRGRPKKANKAPERVTAKAYKHKGGRKVADEGEEQVDEKAVSKKQQKFMGMVHAAQKGEKPASKEVAKVAKTMKKKDAEDFASTKHKGLPEKVKSKKREKTTEAGGSETPTASSGFAYGKGIYDSMNRDLENMIKESMARLDESMSVNVSSDSEGQKNITVTASDEDAVKLAEILKNAGLGGGSEGAPHDEPHGADDTCPTCGSTDCGCGDVHEALGEENEPDWPTNPEVSDDALQYAGGLNGPKSTGQTVGAPFNRQNARQGAGELVGNGVNEDLARIKSLAQKLGGVAKGVAKKGLETLGHGDDEAMRKDLQKKMGLPQTGKKPGEVAESLRTALEQFKKQ